MHQVRKSLAVAILLCGMTAGVATAQTAPAAAPAFPVAFNVGVWSQYIFRGLSQTDFKPAIQGGADYAHDSGLYVGVWGSNIEWLRDFGISSGRVELDIYGGYKKSLTDDIAVDVGFLRYQYLGSVKDGFVNPNTNEVYAALSYKFITAKYSHALSNAFGTAESKHTTYWDLTAAIPVADTWTLTVHGGKQKFRGPSADAASYSDFKVEIAKDFGSGISAGAGVTTTDADKSFYTPVDKKFIGKDTGYVFVKYNF
ncbi:MAG: hypothetical protein IPM02_16650 [Betaproteobacteria bacterium]|nr:hypothetical protein [Betaproteobacteria bacterium]